MTNTYGLESIHLNLIKPISGVHTVQFLINAGDGRARYRDREIGSINFIFEVDDIPHQPYPVILGQNVREWAVGNFVTDDAGKPELLVDTVKDPNSREFWRGETRDGQVAVMDMLAVRVEAAKRTKKLIAIEFTRSIPRNTIGLDYFISGITLEVGMARSYDDKNDSGVEHQVDLTASAANGDQRPGQTDDETTKYLLRELITATREFDERLSQGMPGSSAQRYTQLTNQVDIRRLMLAIGRDCRAYELWSIQNAYGLVGMWSTDTIKSLDDDVWLIKYLEAKIKEAWLHRDPVLEKQYVVLQLAPMPPFGIEQSMPSGYAEVGYFQGQYIKRSEYEDGYALIDGQAVKVQGAELRARYLRGGFIFLTPRPTHYVQNSAEAEDVFESVFKSLEVSGRITVEVLEPLRKIKRLHWMTLYD